MNTAPKKYCGPLGCWNDAQETHGRDLKHRELSQIMVKQTPAGGRVGRPQSGRTLPRPLTLRPSSAPVSLCPSVSGVYWVGPLSCGTSGAARGLGSRMSSAAGILDGGVGLGYWEVVVGLRGGQWNVRFPLFGGGIFNHGRFCFKDRPPPLTKLGHKI